jgi:hypothetical protein
MTRCLAALALVGLFALAGCGSHAQAPRRGTVSARPAGTLYLAGTSPGTVTVVNVWAGRARRLRLRELSPGDPPYLLYPTGGRIVVYGHSRTYAFGPSLREPARSLGESWLFVPSATAGRVWLILLDRHRFALHGTREVTVRGRTVFASGRRLPHWPVGAVPSGLLLQASRLEVWDPASGGVVRTLPGVFPAAIRGALVANCAPGCPVLHVSDTGSGEDVVIRPLAGVRFVESYDGAFSPDGRLLAVPVAVGRHRYRVALVDVDRRTVRLVPGARLANDYTLLAWASSGWLFFNAGHGRVAAYRPGTDGATVLPLRVAPFVEMEAR